MGRLGSRSGLRTSLAGTLSFGRLPRAPGDAKYLLTPYAQCSRPPDYRAGRGTERMRQQALGAASIAVAILLFLLLVGLLYDLITGYSARRRFARLLALRNFYLRCRPSSTTTSF